MSEMTNNVDKQHIYTSNVDKQHANTKFWFYVMKELQIESDIKNW